MSIEKPNAFVYPWLLDPKLSPAIWGGGELVRDYGKHGDPHAKIGESWECWDTDAVINGALEGSTIATLRERLGAEFLGGLDPTQIFPVLTKIITARDWLSVQVHPDDAYAQRVEHQPVGKTECWYVMAARAGAEFVVGWTRDTSRAEYEKRVSNGTLAEILRKIPLKAGDTVYVPSGMVREVREMVDAYNPRCNIEVDGGLDAQNMERAVTAGATILVAGSSIFKATTRRLPCAICDIVSASTRSKHCFNGLSHRGERA